MMSALLDGQVSWADLLCTPEEDERSRREASEKTVPIVESTFEVHPLKTAPKPVAPLERVVPAFTPGIKTLMAKNLPRDIKLQELRSIFEKYGPIKDIYIPKNMDKSSEYFGTIKGFATIVFLKSTDSANAYTNEWSLINIRNKHIALEFAKEDRRS